MDWGRFSHYEGNEAIAKEIAALLHWRICKAVKPVPLADGVIAPLPCCLLSIHPSRKVYFAH